LVAGDRLGSNCPAPPSRAGSAARPGIRALAEKRGVTVGVSPGARPRCKFDEPDDRGPTSPGAGRKMRLIPGPILSGSSAGHVPGPNPRHAGPGLAGSSGTQKNCLALSLKPSRRFLEAGRFGQGIPPGAAGKARCSIPQTIAHGRPGCLWPWRATSRSKFLPAGQQDPG